MTPTMVFDSNVNPSLGAGSISPFWEYNMGTGGGGYGRRAFMTTFPDVPAEACVALESTDSTDRTMYGTANRDGSIASRAQLGTNDILPNGTAAFPRGQERTIVLRFHTDTPGETSMMSGYSAYGAPYAILFEVHGEPYGGTNGLSPPTAIYLGAVKDANGNITDPNRVVLRSAKGRWATVIDRWKTYTLIMRLKANSAPGSGDGWEEIYIAPAGQPVVQIKARTAYEAIAAGNNDSLASGNRIILMNYHRAMMVGWQGLHRQYVSAKVYTGLAVANTDADRLAAVREVDPYTLGGGVVVPTPAVLVSGDVLVDSFDAAALDSGRWPTISGAPFVSGGKVTFPVATSDTNQRLLSDHRYDMRATSKVFGPWQVGAIQSGTGTFEALRLVMYQDQGAVNDLLIRVVKTDVDPAGKLSAAFITGGVEDASLPLASVSQVTFNAVSHAYQRVTVAANGRTITAETAPDSTGPWTLLRSATAVWDTSTTGVAFLVGARTTVDLPVVSATSLGGVGVIGVAPVTAGVAKLPAGIASGTPILLLSATGNPSAAISNLGALPFAQLAPETGTGGITAGSPATAQAWLGVKRYDPATDVADWTVQFAAATGWAIETLALPGMDGAASDYGVIEVTPVSETTAATSHAVTVTTTVPGEGVLYLGAVDTDATVTTWGVAPAGWTKVFGARETSDGIDVAGYFRTVDVPGAVSATFTHGKSAPAAAYVVRLRPGAEVVDNTTTVLSPQADGLGAITGAVTVSMAGLTSGVYAAKLTGDTTITVTNLARFASIMFRIVQSTAGGHTLTIVRDGGIVRWPFGATGTLSPIADSIDLFVGVGSPTGVNLEMFVVGQELA